MAVRHPAPDLRLARGAQSWPVVQEPSAISAFLVRMGNAGVSRRILSRFPNVAVMRTLAAYKAESGELGSYNTES